jgi:8-oxo-dGTP pyrophosphatase MutT (NUDIX family)
MSFEDRMERLAGLLAGPLPGEAVKARMRPSSSSASPSSRSAPARSLQASGVRRDAAVLILLYPDGGNLCLPLMKRTHVEGDVHAGQISLPGGGREPGEHAEETALREAYEELGIQTDGVRVLGRLSRQWIPVSGYEVVPVVGATWAVPSYRRDPAEVAEVIVTSVEELESPARQSTFRQRRADRSEVTWPCWRLDQGILWGATAMILSELLVLLREPESPADRRNVRAAR